MIPIILNTWNRFPLMQVCVQTLMDSDLPDDIEIHAFDDCSSDERVIPFLKSFPIRVFRFESQLGCDEAIKTSLRQVYAELKVPWLIHVEDDVYFHLQWYREFMRMIDCAKEQDIPVGLGTVFRTAAHVPNRRLEAFDCLSATGAPTLLINTNLLEGLKPGGRGFDWDIGSLCTKADLEIICSKRSWVEHLGQIGAHATGKDSESRGMDTELPGIFEKYVEEGDLWQSYP